jgi:hypothetical protein
MSRIVYSASTPFGKITAEAVDHVLKAQDAINRAVAVANAVSAGGATPANLEGSAEFGVATGGGSNFYTAINDLKTNLAAITSVSLSQIDMGG